MSPFDQRLRANLVHVDVEGGSGMIFATAVTKMLQPAAEIRLPGLYDLFRVPTGGSARMAITPPRCRQRSRRAAPSTAVDRSKPRRYGPRAMVAASRLLGRSQVVRQRILIPPFPGSKSWRPSQIKALKKRRYFAALLGPLSSFRNSFRASFRNSVPGAFDKPAIRCACRFRVAASARSIVRLAYPS